MLVVEHDGADFAGLNTSINDANVQVINNLITHNGDSGINVPGNVSGNTSLTNVTIRGNTITDNNYRNFQQLWHAGGIKMAADAYGLIEDNEIAGNRGPGIWMDYENRNSRCTQNVIFNTRSVYSSPGCGKKRTQRS